MRLCCLDVASPKDRDLAETCVQTCLGGIQLLHRFLQDLHVHAGLLQEGGDGQAMQLQQHVPQPCLYISAQLAGLLQPARLAPIITPGC